MKQWRFMPAGGLSILLGAMHCCTNAALKAKAGMGKISGIGSCKVLKTGLMLDCFLYIAASRCFKLRCLEGWPAVQAQNCLGPPCSNKQTFNVLWTSNHANSRFDMTSCSKVSQVLAKELPCRIPSTGRLPCGLATPGHPVFGCVWMCLDSRLFC